MWTFVHFWVVTQVEPFESTNTKGIVIGNTEREIS